MRLQLSPTLRISLGLVGLCLSLFILSDALFGLVADRSAQARVLRTRIAETTTAQLADALREQDLRRVTRMMEGVRDRNPDLVSIGVRHRDGELLLASGPHAPSWSLVEGQTSSLTEVVVPILSAQGTWGRAEFEFQRVTPASWRGWLSDRTAWLMVGLPLGLLFAVYLYLRRSLMHLNPMSVVPDRLRMAFDGLVEGVALLDDRGRVILANQALRQMAAIADAQVHGRPLTEAVHLSLPDAGTPPWLEVLREGQTHRDVRVIVGQGDARKLGVMHCSPILDGRGRVRGCLATVDDQTAIQRSNEELREALAKLEASRTQIEAQNQELIKLATRDALTGLLNRRAFFSTAEALLARVAESGGMVVVMMLDVDHFKSFNDRYGHDVGDQVLQRVAKSVSESLRLNDIVARYGGEEFCVMAEVADAATGAMLAERVRHAIQNQAGAGMRQQGRVLSITASVGVAMTPPGPQDLQALLKLADESLYVAKRNGRNRVVVSGQAVPAAPTEAAATPADGVLDLVATTETAPKGTAESAT